MTLASLYTLQDAMEEALVATNRGTTNQLIAWMRKNKADVLAEEENHLVIEDVGLGNMFRSLRKKRDGGPEIPEKAQNLCFDFGLTVLDLPDEISVPFDMKKLPYSPCRWADINDCTVDDLDKHLELQDVQIDLAIKSRAAVRQLRQAAAQVVPGRTDIPLKELRAILRARNGNAGAAK